MYMKVRLLRLLVFLGFQRQCLPAMAGYRLIGVGGNVLKLSRKNRDREVTIGKSRLHRSSAGLLELILILGDKLHQGKQGGFVHTNENRSSQRGVLFCRGLVAILRN